MKRPSKKTLLLTMTILGFAVGVGYYSLSGTPEQKEARYLKKGIALFEKEEYAKARLEFKNALQLKPTDPEVFYRLGLVDESERQFQNAFANFMRAQQQDDHYAPALLKTAQYYLIDNVATRAQENIDKVLKTDPKNAEAHALLASLKMRQKDLASAEKEGRIAVENDPSNTSGAAILSTVYLTQNDFPKAEKVLQDAIDHNGKDISLRVLKAALYEKQGDFDKLDAAYRDLFKAKPDVVRFRINLATIYLKTGQIDRAEAVLRDGTKALPDNWDMKRELVAFLEKNRGFEATEKEIKSLTKTNSDKVEPFFWLAEIYNKNGRTSDATAVLKDLASKAKSDSDVEKAKVMLARMEYANGNKEAARKEIIDVLAKNGNNKDALLAKATMDYENASYDDTIISLRGVLKIDPKDERAYPMLAEALAAQGHTDLAIDTLNQLMDITPENNNARVRLAQFYQINGNSSRADDLLDIVIRKNPALPIVWETKARFALLAKKFTAAEGYIKKLDTLNGQHATVLYLEGSMAAMTNKPDLALQKFEDIIRTAPNSSWSRFALSDLNEIGTKTKQLAKVAAFLKQLNSNAPDILTALGECQIKLEEKAEAEKTLDKALASKPTSQSTYLLRAKLYKDAKQTEKAAKILDDASKAFPSDIRADLMKGDLLMSSQKDLEAMALYEVLADRAPNNAAAVNNWAALVSDYAFDNQPKLEKARRKAEIFLNSKDPFLLDTVAWIYYRQGQFQQAQSVIEKALTSMKSIPAQLHYHYGAILLQTGHKQQAKAELQKAMSGDTNYPGYNNAVDLLKKN